MRGRDLFQLLHLVNKGDISGLEEFARDHAEVLSEYELSATTLLRQCRQHFRCYLTATLLSLV